MERVSVATPEYVESGQYYEDAKDWYATRYILPFTERSYYVFISLISLLIITLLAINIYSLFPVIKKVPFFNTVDNFAREYSVIRSLQNEDITVNQTIALYLVSHYVKMREEYYPDNDKIKSQFYFIHKNSSAPLFKAYQDGISTRNPNSPLLVYQRHTLRTIDITNVQFDENPLRPETLIITYRATVISASKQESSDWQTIVSFNLSDPIISLYNNLPFEFTVTSYDTTKL